VADTQTADTQTADNRALREERRQESRTAAQHFMVGAGFLVLAGELQLLALLSLRFDDLFPISYGRLAPMADFTMMIGFVAVSLIGGAYYALPRLTGARLWGRDLAASSLVGLTAAVFVGLFSIAFGAGGGRQPFGLPWWLDAALVFLLAAPALVAVGTVANRVEKRSYVTLWFVIGGLLWLPLLYLTYLSGALPYFHSIAVEYHNVFFSAGFTTMFVFTVGTGLLYYTMVKELDVPLASRQLALIGFWSLGLASVWWGDAQLLFGPSPEWVSGVGAALGLAFPVGALVNAVNISLSLEGAWDEVRERPAVRAGVVGAYLGVGVAVMAALAGFRSIASVTSLTAFWEAVEYAALAGVGALLVASVAFAAMPRLINRRLPVNRAKAFITLTLTGAVGVLISMSAAGVVSGYSWVGGSNAVAYVDAGDGWAAGLGSGVDNLMLIAALFAALTFVGQVVYATAVIGPAFFGEAAPAGELDEAGERSEVGDLAEVEG